MNFFDDDDINPDAMKTEQIKRMIRMRAHDKEIERRSRMSETMEMTQEFQRNLYAKEDYETHFAQYLEMVPHIQMGVVSVMLRAYAMRRTMERLSEIGLDADTAMSKATEFYQVFGQDKERLHGNEQYFRRHLLYPQKGRAFKFGYTPFAGQQSQTWPTELLDAKTSLLEQHYQRAIERVGTLNTSSDYADANEDIERILDNAREHALEWVMEFQNQFSAFNHTIDWMIEQCPADERDTTRETLHGMILEEYDQGLTRSQEFADTINRYLKTYLIPLETGLTEDRWMTTTTLYQKKLDKQAKEAAEAAQQAATQAPPGPPPLPAPPPQPETSTGLWGSLRKAFGR